MNIGKKTYKEYAKAHAGRSPSVKNCALAFATGGGICAVAEGLKSLFLALGMNRSDAGLTVSVTLIFAAALFTALGWFDKLAKHSGAGTLVPITGFANAVVSPAIDAKAEGWILGVGSKIFTVAGPVLLYGTLAGTVYGVIYYFASVLHR